MDLMLSLPLVLVAAGCGGLYAWVGCEYPEQQAQDSNPRKRKRQRSCSTSAEKEAETLKREKLLEVKDEWYQKKKEFDSDVQSKRSKFAAQEKALEVREENIDRKVELLSRKEREHAALKKTLDERVCTLNARDGELERLLQEENQRLEHLSGLSREEAKRQLIDNLTNEARSEAALQLKDIRDTARDEAKREAQKLIVQAIQRTAADHSVETTVSVLNIQSDEMKGRIIGREGRNIRAFEAATGVDVIVDDTPEAVILSAFDPFRREVARVATGPAHRRWPHSSGAHRRGRGKSPPGIGRGNHTGRGEYDAGSRPPWYPQRNPPPYRQNEIPVQLRAKHVEAQRGSGVSYRRNGC